MSTIALTRDEVVAIQALLARVTAQYQSVEDPDFLRRASYLAYQLPERICKALCDMRMLEPVPGVCLISGYPIDQAKIGRTPIHWNARPEVSLALEEEVFLMLCGSLLGDVFGFLTEQNGHLVNDILPIAEHEQDQVSSSSNVVLGWHNEDAFHPYRGDYLGLMCMRNPYQGITRYVSIDMIPLTRRERELLSEPHFVIRPDNAHLHHLQELENLDEAQQAAIARIRQIERDHQKVPVLSGHVQSPYVSLDPYYMDPVEDPEAAEALESLSQKIEAHGQEIVLQPGDILFLDNFKVMHGRKPFQARYDGNDRWLKRINITRDLRKSRGARSRADSRIVL